MIILIPWEKDNDYGTETEALKTLLESVKDKDLLKIGI